jgi:hypothetical protein
MLGQAALYIELPRAFAHIHARRQEDENLKNGLKPHIQTPESAKQVRIMLPISQTSFIPTTTFSVELEGTVGTCDSGLIGSKNLSSHSRAP